MAFCGLAAAARFWLLLRRPLWHDEIFTTWASRLPPLRLFEVLRSDSGPPLFYLLQEPIVRAVEALAISDRWLRLPSWLAVGAVWFIGARCSTGRSRNIFLVLAATSPFLLLYSAEARAYGLLAALDLGAFFLLARGTQTRGRVLAGGALAAAALYTHYLSLFFLGGLALVLAATRRRRCLAALAGAGVLFLPWLPILFEQPLEATAWVHDTFGTSLVGFASTLGGAGRIPPPFGAPLPWPLLGLGVAAGLLAIGGVLSATKQDEELRSGAAVVGVTLAAILVYSLVRPVAFAGRSEMSVLGLWLWLLARAAQRTRLARAAAFAVVLLGATASIFCLARPLRVHPAGAAVSALSNRVRPGDRVFAGSSFYLPARLAADRGQIAGVVESFPAEIATHPGWFLPRPASETDYRELRARLGTVAAGGRVYLLVHPYYAGEAMARTLAGGRNRPLIWTPDAALIEWSPPRTAGVPFGKAPASDARR